MCYKKGMKRKSLEGNACAIARSLDIIGDWWSLLIVRDVAGDVRRFSDIQRHLGIPKNILASRLKSLQEHEILTAAPTAGAHHEYHLTPRGRALVPVLVAIGQWGREHLFSKHEACFVALDAATETPLAKLELKAADGRHLTPEDVLIRDTDA